MKSIASVSLVGCLLFLNACATHTRPATPVNLTVSSDTADDRFVADVRNATLDAIHAQVPNARPMTIAINFDVATRGHGPMIIPSKPNQQRNVPPVTTDPNEGARATVPVNHSAFDFQSTEVITGFRVSYAISDAAGRVVESNQLALDHGYLVDATTGTPVNGSGKGSRFSIRRDPVRDTARFLASRVKTLSQ